MAEAAKPEQDFELKGIKFSYQKDLKTFHADQQGVLSLLKQCCPDSYSKIVDKFPELKVVEIIETEAAKDGSNENKAEPDLKGNKGATAETKDGKDDIKAANSNKSGMISKLSKGIKKIIAKLTPKKLRKKWNLEEKEEVVQTNQNGDKQ